jgi:hypothetical protein
MRLCFHTVGNFFIIIAGDRQSAFSYVKELCQTLGPHFPGTNPFAWENTLSTEGTKLLLGDINGFVLRLITSFLRYRCPVSLRYVPLPSVTGSVDWPPSGNRNLNGGNSAEAEVAFCACTGVQQTKCTRKHG